MNEPKSFMFDLCRKLLNGPFQDFVPQTDYDSQYQLCDVAEIKDELNSTRQLGY